MDFHRMDGEKIIMEVNVTIRLLTFKIPGFVLRKGKKCMVL